MSDNWRQLVYFRVFSEPSHFRLPLAPSLRSTPTTGTLRSAANRRFEFFVGFHTHSASMTSVAYPADNERVVLIPVSVDEDDEDAQLAQSLRKQFTRDKRTIFNGSERQNDGRRLQAPLRFGSRDADLVHRKLVSTLESFFGRTRFEEFTMRNWVILVSLPGCAEQMLHTDFDSGLIQRSLRATGGTSWGMIYAIESGTKLIVQAEDDKPAETLYIPRGYMLLFRGDVVHAGAQYDKENLRVHAYIDHYSVPRVRDRTFLVGGVGSRPKDKSCIK